MIRFAPLLVLAACSAEPSENAPGPVATAAAATPVASVGATATPADTAQAKPGTLKTFGDWTVGCDNTALCQMASLGPADGGFPQVTMALLRQPGPGGAYDLSFEVAEDGEPVVPTAVAIDGRRVALPTLNGAPAGAVASAMTNGEALAILESDGKTRAQLSLAGAAAALRYIDAVQGRAGTVTATVAKGARPARAVPEPRDAPLIRALAPSGAAAKPTVAQYAAMRARAKCGDDAGAAATDPEAHALGGGATLVLLPCSAGAYNLSSALFIVRGSSVEPAVTDAPSGFGPTPAEAGDALPSVVNGDWSDGVLASYAKGRGLGDCGVRQQFVWDGARLRLTDQSEMGDCRGNANYITTWRAQVVRR